MIKPIVLWGATGQARVLNELINEAGLQLIALFDNNPELKSPIPGAPLYYGRKGFEDWHGQQTGNSILFLVAIGGSRGKDRMQIQYYLEQKGLIPYLAIHSTASLARSAAVGPGSQILAGSVIGSCVTIGAGCIVNTGAIIDHDCSIGNGVHICPGAVLAGCIEVNSYATIGSGAVILPRLKVHQGAVVGAGAVVTKSVPAYTTVAGNPARILRSVR